MERRKVQTSFSNGRRMIGSANFTRKVELFG